MSLRAIAEAISRVKRFKVSRGLTFLELLVVLAIMALFTGMSAPAISGHLRGARLRGGARQIASALRMARQLAITNRAIYTVDFDINNREFWVEWGNTPTTIGEKNMVVEVRTLPDTIDFHSFRLGYLYPAPYPYYSFSARGTTVGHWGTIRIVDPNNNRMSIVIFGVTGRIRIEPYPPQ